MLLSELERSTVPKTDLLQGTLDLLILKILTLGPNHGWGIANRIRQISRDGLNASQGSLYPALHRLELSGDVESEMTASENNRRARVYTLTPRRPAPSGSRDSELGTLRAVDEADPAGTNEPLVSAERRRMLARLCRLRSRIARRAADPMPKSTTSCRFTSSRRSRRNVARGMSPGGGETDGAARSRRPDADDRVRARRAHDLARPALARRSPRRAARCAATPAFTTVALVVLTLSIGATTAIFSVVDAVVLRGLPFRESDRLVAVGELNVKDSSRRSTREPRRAAELSRLAGPAGRLHRPGRRRLRRDQPARGGRPRSRESCVPRRVTADFFSCSAPRRFSGVRSRPTTKSKAGRAWPSSATACGSDGLVERPTSSASSCRASSASFEIRRRDAAGLFVSGRRAASRPTCGCRTCSAATTAYAATSFGYDLHVIGRLRDGVSIDAGAGADGSDHRAPGGRDAALVHGPRRQGRAAAAIS